MKKTCCDCNQEKTISEFHKDSSSADGHRFDCKLCYNSKQRLRKRAIAKVKKDDQGMKDTSKRVLEAIKSYYNKYGRTLTNKELKARLRLSDSPITSALIELKMMNLIDDQNRPKLNWGCMIDTLNQSARSGYGVGRFDCR